MVQLQTYRCEHCGDEFAAVAGANAAEKGYCSPSCESAGEGLA